MSLYVQVHTLKIKRRISAGEVGRICRTFSIPEIYDSENQLYISPTGCRGIKNICIEKKLKWRGGQANGFQYSVELEINVVKLLNKAEVSMAEMSPANAKEMYDKINDYLVKILQLDVRNCKSRNWTMVDLHCGFDVKVPDVDIDKIPFIIRAMNRSLDLENQNHCRIPYNAIHLNGQEKYESLRFENNYYTYNIYYKYQELVNKGIVVSPQGLQEARNTIRIEMQMKSSGVNKKVGSPQEFGLLESIAVSNKLLQMVCRDMKWFFGKGAYVSYEDAMALIDASSFTQDEKLYMKIMYTGAYRFNLPQFLDGVWKAYVGNEINWIQVQQHVKETIKQLETLGIAVGGLSKAELSQIQVNRVENINTYIDMMFVPVVKAGGKGVFSKIAPIEKGRRWKCQPVIHDITGNSKRHQITGITPRRVEIKVLNLLQEEMLKKLSVVTSVEEQKSILLQTKEQVEKFATVLHTKEGMADVCEFLDRLTKMIT
ncbi:MAG: hypothetical protein ACI4E1_10280 [Lachnospira sp.]